MIKLKKVTINKYKCIETEQSFDVEDDITVLVGKNESGKTAILESITKSNSYRNDKFDSQYDYPKREKKRYDRGRADVTVIRCTYKLSDQLQQAIEEDIGVDTLLEPEAVHSTSYKCPEGRFEPLTIDLSRFYEHKFTKHDIRDSRFKARVRDATSTGALSSCQGKAKGGKTTAFIRDVISYFSTSVSLEESLSRHVIDKWLQPQLPKFLYYDHYYELPSDIRITDIQHGAGNDDKLKTAKALFELADINVSELVGADNYEAYKSELEATGVDITLKLFEYWKTNSNLRVEFDIDRQSPDFNSPILKIRVFNNKYLMSLPLGSRSRGFNWFFSFLVWFSKIQEARDTRYILLLDEPGLSLHASAQADLLRFVEALAHEYQVIYTTHSPFMIDSGKLHRVRTVFEGENGTRIRNGLDEEDGDTLFPLKAALGYNIAQNLFVAENNLIVEGVSDHIYLRVMSSLLEDKGMKGLDSSITVVPVGGLGRLASFVSLLYGQDLNLVCLLDGSAKSGGVQQASNLVKQKLIADRNIVYVGQFASNRDASADIEDMFEESEYLHLYNTAFHEQDDICENDLNSSRPRIVKRIEAKTGKFNHYRPARALSALSGDSLELSENTLKRFEAMFVAINKLFERLM